MAKATRILIVDDHALFREGLVSVFNNQPDFTVVGEAASVEEAVCLAKSKIFDLALMDIGLPDGDGLQAMDSINEIREGISFVFLTVHESEEVAFAALRRGAKGYLTKDIDIQKLLAALRAIDHGELAVSRELSSRYIEETSRWLRMRSSSQVRDHTLTSREVEVLAEVGAGFDNNEIGLRLSISPNTVKVHVNNIAHKLGLNSRRELVEYARRHGFRGTIGPLAVH